MTITFNCSLFGVTVLSHDHFCVTFSLPDLLPLEGADLELPVGEGLLCDSSPPVTVGCHLTLGLDLLGLGLGLRPFIGLSNQEESPSTCLGELGELARGPGRTWSSSSSSDCISSRKVVFLSSLLRLVFKVSVCKYLTVGLGPEVVVLTGKCCKSVK